MGDLAWQDTQGRLWFCGRKSQRLQTRQGLLGTENVEPIFNRHPAVKRSALVGLGAYGEQQPVLCIEREPGATVSDSVLCSELLSIASQHRHTRQIQIVLFHPGFPVDIRHNAKIGREQLTAWAAKRLAKRA
jgi:acyl-coenzyme A synthetase/AMP-(fatty) acid ligase